jgi:putative phage-type endonuclease
MTPIDHVDSSLLSAEPDETWLSIMQGSDAWKAARLGKVTASRIADVVAKTKNGWGASRANYMAELIVERLTGIPTEGYINGAMQWGTATEPEARMEYQLHTGYAIEQVGFVPHPTIEMAGCSPDGLIGDDGLVEIKCPNSATHIEMLLARGFPSERYEKQIQFQLACTGRQWCDFVSYDPRLPERMRLFIKRIERDPAQIQYLETAAIGFLLELHKKIVDLDEIYNNERNPI